MPLVDGRPIPFDAHPHPAYAEAISRAGKSAERSLDRLVKVVDDLIDIAGRALPTTDRATLERDARRALEEHEENCDWVVWWSKVVTDKE